MTDEVRPCGSMGECVTTICVDITSVALFTAVHKFHLIKSCYYGSAYFVGGTSSDALRAPPSPQGEGLVSAYFESTDTYIARIDSAMIRPNHVMSVKIPIRTEKQSLDQAFTKACGFQRQSLWSRSTERETSFASAKRRRSEFQCREATLKERDPRRGSL